MNFFFSYKFNVNIYDLLVNLLKLKELFCVNMMFIER